jgi:pyridoxal phosphate enzyme (YggS family)
VAEVRERIARAGGSDITLVAVTKGFGADAVAAAVEAGITDCGENRVDELVAKYDPRVRWHFVGHIQRRDVRRAEGVGLWQSVDRLAAGAEIARRWPGAAALVQVNVSDEPQKHGCTFDEAPALVTALVDLGLDVRGVMAIGPAGDPEAARPGFRRLATLAAALDLHEVSMGMTDDLEVAVQEGSTMVRVGRALFGPRPVGSAARR